MPRKGCYCMVPQCTNTTVRTPDKVFISCPSDPKQRKKWFEAARRDPSKETGTVSRFRVCQDHFNVESDFENWNYVQFCRQQGQRAKVALKPNIVPTKFECQTSRLVTVKKRLSVSDKLERKRILQQLITGTGSQTPNTSSVPINTEPISDCHESTSQHPAGNPYSTDAEAQNIYSEDGLSLAYQLEKGVQVCLDTCDKGVQVNMKVRFRSTAVQATRRVTSSLTSPMKFPQPPAKKPRYDNPSTSTPKIRLSNIQDDDANEEEDVVTSSSSFSVTSSSVSSPSIGEGVKRETHAAKNLECTLRNVEKRPKLYLGVTEESFFVVELLCTESKCCKRDVLLTLKKLRCNHQFVMLGDDFGVSEVHASRIFRKTLAQISVPLKQLVYWPQKHRIQKLLPIPFRKQYKSVVSIIDCFEIQIEKPSDPFHQAMTWSSYYNCNTVKYLISCTPNGFVSLISKGFGGRITDLDIVNQSGYLNQLERGDDVLSDRGFKGLSAALSNLGCRLIRPPSVAKGEILTEAVSKDAKKIASLRVHVERVIGRLREFKFLTPHATVDNKLICVLDLATVSVCGLINTQSVIL